MTESADLEPALVYEWPGPPRIALMRAPRVSPGGVEYLQHWLSTGDGSDGVVVYAESAGQVLLSHQHRVVGDAWELPRGFGELRSGGPLADGIREFREETGLLLEEARVVGRFVLDSSVLPTWVSVVHGFVSDRSPTQSPDGELDAMKWSDVDQISALVASGGIADAISLSAIAVVNAAKSPNQRRV